MTPLHSNLNATNMMGARESYICLSIRESNNQLLIAPREKPLLSLVELLVGDGRTIVVDAALRVPPFAPCAQLLFYLVYDLVLMMESTARYFISATGDRCRMLFYVNP